MQNIDLNEYDYYLPEDRIAQYPLKERDKSRLLFYDGRSISSGSFSDLDKYLPSDSFLVFNNTRVIKARLLFRKPSGAGIEILCLEPIAPAEYETSFGSNGPVEWKCIIGNLKKWKNGSICLDFETKKGKRKLCAEKVAPEGDAWSVRFSWDDTLLGFGEVVEAAGHIPLPPYISRNDEPADSQRYQTVYSRIKGSVAAPTAGLHFTENTLNKLTEKGIRQAHVTLHVGAGTFQPVRASNIGDHEMHCEHFFVTRETLKMLIDNQGNVISVGTTSVRTLESLYWMGVRVLAKSADSGIIHLTDQWEPYRKDTSVPVRDSLNALLELSERNGQGVLEASTRLMIIPGYKFRMIEGMLTNFHQPRSTLLLLVSAWSGPRWKEIYKYAIDNNFRFLSYGDTSLLLR